MFYTLWIIFTTLPSFRPEFDSLLTDSIIKDLCDSIDDESDVKINKSFDLALALAVDG